MRLLYNMAQQDSTSLEQFLEDMTISGSYSPHTLYAYKKDLKLYHAFLNQGQPPSHKGQSPGFKDHKPPGADHFYEYMTQHGLSPRSQARVVSSVRAYFRFLKSSQELKTLRPVPVKTTLPRPVSLKEFKQIVQASRVQDIHKTARNHITLLLLFGLGCRVSELINLSLQDLSEMDQSLLVTGKRNKQRVLPLTNDLFQKLMDYIRVHRPCLVRESGAAHLLVNNKGRRPARVDVWRWLAHWSQKAGLRHIQGPHKFRHGFAAGLLENGADLRSIQMLLGHSSIQTTQIYTAVQKKHLQKTIQHCHPLSS